MFSNAFIRGFMVAGLLGLAVAVLLALLAPRLGRQALETVRMPLDARYRAPAVVAMPERDSHFLSLMQSHAPLMPPATWEPLWSTGTAGGIERVESGEAGFALVRSNYPQALGAVAWLGTEHLLVLTDPEAPMETFADLAETRVGIGEAFSDSAMLADRLLTAFHLTPAPETLAMPRAAMLEALEAGELEAVLILAPLDDPDVADLLLEGAYRLLPIPQHEALTRSMPGVHATHIPAGSFGPNRGVPPVEAGDLPTVSVDVLVAAPPHAPYWHAWNLVRTVNAPAFMRAAPGRVGAEKPALASLGYPVHAAARDFHGRLEPAPAGRMERIGFTLAAMVLFVGMGAVLRAQRRIRQSKEQRTAMVPYFESVEKLRHAAERAREAGELRTVQNGLAHLQQQAEDEWLEGYLDTADMGNLYAAIGGGRTRAAHRQLQGELAQVREQLEQVRLGLQGGSQPQASPPPASSPSRPKTPEIEDELEEDVPSILLEPEQTRDKDTKGSKE